MIFLGGIVEEQRKKNKSMVNSRTRCWQAKAFVISVMGEFATMCRSKQVFCLPILQCGQVYHTTSAMW